MNEIGAERLPACFQDYPGVVLQVTAAGRIHDSNGVLELELGRELRGADLHDLVDRGSSRVKVGRLLALLADDSVIRDTWELILDGDATLVEPRAFAAVRDRPGGLLWLIEQRRDPRLDDLRERVVGVNTELAGTQRDLLKERARLNRALAELEALAAELRRSNAALDEFAHVVSHDLKAPLRSIAQHAEWLVEDLGEAASDDHRRHAERILDRTRRMRAMTQGILEYARVGRLRAQPERVEVGRLVEECTDLLDLPDDARIDIEPGMPELSTERFPLQQIFVNLIGNALKHGRSEAPVVRVGHRRREPASWEFSVSDEGPGIPERMQSRIWALFHTGDPEGEGENTGIGLAVVRRLVESRGGDIRVESRPGEGATFRFTWPDAPREAGTMDAHREISR